MRDWDNRAAWYERAESLKPELKHWEVRAQSMVAFVHDEQAWQKCGVRKVAEGREIGGMVFRPGQSLTVDFGETLVGRIRVRIRTASGKNDSPLRLRFYAAELPYEASSNPDSCRGELSRTWMQDDVVNIDILPGEFQLPRRYSLHYLRLEVLAGSGGVVFEDICVIAEAAEMEIPAPPPGLSELHAAIDQVGLRTLRNCMQLVMEDGPKRDRRLWLGDLRLQALPNSVSYRRFDLIERSLLLLAAATDDNGRAPGCVFIDPELRHGDDPVDYSLLYADVIDGLVRDTGDLELGRSFYPLAARQFELIRPCFDANGVYQLSALDWHFVDWAKFDQQMSMQAIYIFGLKALARLAARLGLPSEAHMKEADLLAGVLRKRNYDPVRSLVVSNGNISYASQIWAILAGIFTPAEAAKILHAMENEPGAVRPATPYMQHHLLEAYRYAGERTRADELMNLYWGGMIRAGADTFWEAYRPGEDFLSPYGEPLLNSACHAWSCTPSYFLRKSAL